ncbi:MAG: stage II sporulation protein M [Planctomycetes bacterium]|nr:stage II sporulation protein M [Planctomycetota bacterium]
MRRAEGRGGGGGRGVPSLSAQEVGELGRLYRAAAAHLAQARTFGASARRLLKLNGLVARAHAVVYAERGSWSFRGFVLRSLGRFPEVVRRTFPFHAAAAALLVAGGLIGFFGALEDPEWGLLFLPAEEVRTPFASREVLLETLLQGRGEHGLWTSGAKASFAGFLWGHNTRAALLAFFGGALLGLPTVFVLLSNGAMLGVYTATFDRAGLAYEWWAWILPHGVTELLGVVLLSGGGLFIGRTILAPGAASRVAALARIRGAVLLLVFFAFPMFLFAAAIESFLRQSNLSDEARHFFAAASAVAWALYLGLARAPRALLEAGRRAPTVAEARVPLPEGEELLGRRALRWAVLRPAPSPRGTAG